MKYVFQERLPAPEPVLRFSSSKVRSFWTGSTLALHLPRNAIVPLTKQLRNRLDWEETQEDLASCDFSQQKGPVKSPCWSTFRVWLPSWQFAGRRLGTAYATLEPAGRGVIYSVRNPVCTTSESGTGPLRHYPWLLWLKTSCFSDNWAFKYNNEMQ